MLDGSRPKTFTDDQLLKGTMFTQGNVTLHCKFNKKKN